MAIRWDGADRTLFVDGALAGTDAVAGPVQFDTSNIVIGADVDGVPSYFFPGAIDDLRIYAVALENAEVLALAMEE